MSVHMRDMSKIRVCPECNTNLQFGSGCYHCPACGYGKCGYIKTIAAFGFTLLCLAVVVLA